jgi:nucleotide-binding universal stress UspA family protein
MIEETAVRDRTPVHEEVVMTQLQATRAATRQRTDRGDIRSILVHVEARPEAAPRLRMAAEFARDCEATLLGVAVQRPPGLGLAGPYAVGLGEGVGELQAAVELGLKEAEDLFRAATAGLKTEWLALNDIPAATLARVSRGADLIVAGGAPLGFSDPYCSADSAELVMLAGRPVLVAPPHGGRLRGEGVVIAWKDTREARRAVADSLPFLRRAREVRVVEVCAGGDAFALAELHTYEVAQYLRRHGIKAEAKAIISPPECVVRELHLQAQAIEADLIVAGAYGHSRTGEWLFGGVTRSLLREPEHFTLLSR